MYTSLHCRDKKQRIKVPKNADNKKINPKQKRNGKKLRPVGGTIGRIEFSFVPDHIPMMAIP